MGLRELIKNIFYEKLPEPVDVDYLLRGDIGKGAYELQFRDKKTGQISEEYAKGVVILTFSPEFFNYTRKR